MVATRERFILALAAVEEKDFEWWGIVKKGFDEDELLGSNEADLPSCFTALTSMGEFMACNN